MDRKKVNMINNAQGKIFENQILAACLGYLYDGRACVDKIPEPFGVTKKDYKTGEFSGRFFSHKKAQPDFQGTVTGGRSIVFEAKKTEKNKIALSVLSSNQEKVLERHYRLGAITGVCVCIKDEFYFVPYALWRLCSEQWDRKYFVPEDLREFKVKFNGAVNFLDMVNGKAVENMNIFVKE
ncbi:Holliday junction resolvase RecU [Megamonas hypermegale]|uniref:Holliday junction resolvase RecU n=1 Tax=Megamonas hypermegale TaxID=158847 RepID=UPI0026F0F8E1|nr:Holliday junction resolvase RecU [Megamonas hypermegale]